MWPLEELRQRWHKTAEGASKVGGLKSLVKSDVDNICDSGLRSVCWKVFLLFQNGDRNTWATATEDTRIAYSALKAHFLRFIERPGDLDTTIDPLNDDYNSPWNTLRRDEELCAEIVQDIERCMPDEPYFRLPETQKILLQILFIYCKINQDIGYRQGMHELAAPILWVVRRDALAPMPPKGATTGSDGDTDHLMLDMLDAKFIEHDSFTLFNLVMRTAKSFYELGEPDNIPNAAPTSSARYGSSPIVQRSKRIHEVLLARVDSELASHLTQIEILPQIFLIRWIRLLFGREFSFDDLLSLWDKLFAEDPDLELIDMVCVSMLLRIRWQLIDADYSVALTLLLKYPHVTSPHGPQTLIEDAVYLRDSLNNPSGAELITKYTGKAPASSSSHSGPASPVGRPKAYRAKSRFSVPKSPLSSSGRFLQEQRSVEALIQGAAKGVFDRSERLGINQVVRDAVGEVKKNMQGLSPGSSAISHRASNSNMLSIEEARAVSVAQNLLAESDARNKTLALLLGDAIGEMQRELTLVGSDSTESAAINNVIEKLRFVRLRLDDPTLPLQVDGFYTTASPEATKAAMPKTHTPTGSDKDIETMKGHKENTFPATIPSPGPGKDTPTRPQSPATQPSEGLDPGPSEPRRPAAVIPTRSTLAQSSFAWMLGPDEHSATSDKTAPVKSPAPFLSSSRKPVLGATRERSAFLFGDDDEQDSTAQVRPVHSKNRDDLGLEIMKKPDAR